MEWWGVIKHPLVKAVAGFSVPLFLALNFPTVFLVGILFYTIALLGVMYTYRRRYRIVGNPELALQLAVKTFSNLKEECNQMVSRRSEEYRSRKALQREREARLRRYRRERNRRKRQQTREALAEQQ